MENLFYNASNAFMDFTTFFLKKATVYYFLGQCVFKKILQIRMNIFGFNYLTGGDAGKREPRVIV